MLLTENKYSLKSLNSGLLHLAITLNKNCVFEYFHRAHSPLIQWSRQLIKFNLWIKWFYRRDVLAVHLNKIFSLMHIDRVRRLLSGFILLWRLSSLLLLLRLAWLLLCLIFRFSSLTNENCLIIHLTAHLILWLQFRFPVIW